jgi:hypothetical protein
MDKILKSEEQIHIFLNWKDLTPFIFAWSDQLCYIYLIPYNNTHANIHTLFPPSTNKLLIRFNFTNEMYHELLVKEIKGKFSFPKRITE